MDLKIYITFKFARFKMILDLVNNFDFSSGDCQHSIVTSITGDRTTRVRQKIASMKFKYIFLKNC